MTNGPLEHLDLINCKNEVEQKMLRMESIMLIDINGMKKDIADIKSDLERLITRSEFEPVKMIAFGLAGGVLIAALGAVMAKVLGW